MPKYHRNADGLTERQARFVDEYMRDLNGQQAAIRAGYSPSTAAHLAFQTLANPRVAAAVARAKAERSARTKLDADLILYELAAIAFSDMHDFVGWNGRGILIRRSENINPHARKAIRELKETNTENGSTLSIKLHDKVRALELLGKHIALFPERHEVTNAPDQDFRVTVQPKPWREALAGMVDTSSEDPALPSPEDGKAKQ
jgi:phage terminase small subunit